MRYLTPVFGRHWGIETLNVAVIVIFVVRVALCTDSSVPDEIVDGNVFAYFFDGEALRALDKRDSGAITDTVMTSYRLKMVPVRNGTC
jgi:hypothetical protein